MRHPDPAERETAPACPSWRGNLKHNDGQSRSGLRTLLIARLALKSKALPLRQIRGAAWLTIDT